jgi:oxygen-independent coproporphyrinogen-3 oxidase
MKRAGIYVHFPWCLAKCPYCDFVSYVSQDAIDHAGYADAILRELDQRAHAFAGRRFESVFFGGGTPSLWAARELGRVLAGLRSRFEGAMAPDAEVTVECNPTSLDEDRARALMDVGVGRLSIGVQSLDDGRLRFLGRLHDGAGGVRAVGDAIRAGLPRVSADLIFGLPEQTPEQARDEAGRLADLGLTHLSCYQLTIEAGTRFGELARRGKLPLAEDGLVAEAFIAIDDVLGRRGLVHYEVSNYAKPGQEARHNIGYWRGQEYLGLGCAAVGFVRTETGGQGAQGVRWRNDVSPQRYMACPAPSIEDREDLDTEALLRERIMLGLRTRDGLDLDSTADELGCPARGWTEERERSAAWLLERGRIVRDRGRVRIPPESWLWTDDTAARLF